MAIIEKKEASKAVKTKGNLVQWEVYSYTGSVKNRDLTLAGTGRVWCFSEKDADLKGVQSLVTLKDVKDINRQRKTDLGNELRVAPSVTKDVKALAKAEPELVADMVELQRQKLTGKVDPALVKKIQDKLAV